MIEARGVAARLAALGLALVPILAIAAWLGHYALDWDDVLCRRAAGEGAPVSIFWTFRLPRVLLGAGAGAGLALGGAVFQALFRNPLAEPYTLGLASGAALGAAIGFVLRQSGANGVNPRLQLFALMGALAAMGVVYAISRLRAGFDVTRLLLAGVCVSYLSAAGILLAHLLADYSITNEIVKWTVGSLDGAGFAPAIHVWLAVVPIAMVALSMHRQLDLLSMGQRIAESRGVAVERSFWIAFGALGLLTAVIVAECGPIGFVGLIIPHAARKIVGAGAGPLMIASMLLGAGFLTLCDGVARTPLPREIPVGLFTNIVGAIFFFVLLARERAD